MNNDAAALGSPAPEPLAKRLWLILGGLRHAIAAWGGRDRAAVPLVLLAWGRVGRLAARFEALVARLAAGGLPVPPPGGQVRVRVRVRAAPLAAAVRLPRGFAWLGQALPEARAFGSQLQALLAEPEMVALLAACPRAGRILRPLCHMLGIAGPGVKLRDPRPARAAAPVVGWGQVAAAICPAPPIGYAPFPPGRAPPGWGR